MKDIYQLLDDQILFGEDETPVDLYVSWNNKTVKYITTDKDGSDHHYFESTKHPEKLTEEERHRVLEYCLGKFYKDEIVNYRDLFLQGEFIKESNIPKNYKLTKEWLNL